MIPDDRAIKITGYVHEGDSIVRVDPPLKQEEWGYLMECQKISLEVKKEEDVKKAIGNKNDGEKEESVPPKPKKHN